MAEPVKTDFRNKVNNSTLGSEKALAYRKKCATYGGVEGQRVPNPERLPHLRTPSPCGQSAASAVWLPTPFPEPGCDVVCAQGAARCDLKFLSARLKSGALNDLTKEASRRQRCAEHHISWHYYPWLVWPRAATAWANKPPLARARAWPQPSSWMAASAKPPWWALRATCFIASLTPTGAESPWQGRAPARSGPRVKQQGKAFGRDGHQRVTSLPLFRHVTTQCGAQSRRMRQVFRQSCGEPGRQLTIKTPDSSAKKKPKSLERKDFLSNLQACGQAVDNSPCKLLNHAPLWTHAPVRVHAVTQRLDHEIYSSFCNGSTYLRSSLCAPKRCFEPFRAELAEHRIPKSGAAIGNGRFALSDTFLSPNSSRRTRPTCLGGFFASDSPQTTGPKRCSRNS